MEPKATPIPKTLREAIVFYDDADNCNRVMMAIRWPNGRVSCPCCGVVDESTWMPSVQRFKCKACRKQFSLKVGTVFEDSPIPLSKWLTAVWLLSGAKNGISSCELSRSLGVTQKSAWFMLHRIREAMATGTFEKFSGSCEADETYIGGREKFKHADKKLHAGTGHVGKSIVMGVLERGDSTKKSRVRAKIIPNTHTRTLHTEVLTNVEEGSAVYTDAHSGYRNLSEAFIHGFIDHAVGYAQGAVHTNSMENYWSLLKRMLKGTYVNVEPYHLERYLDEMAFRFNERGGNDSDRFLTAMSSIVGKRLTYDELTRSYEGYYAKVTA